jgi:hypothetical protein
MMEMNSRVLYRYTAKESVVTPKESREVVLPDLGSVNVFAEVRGKYAPIVHNNGVAELPQIRSKTSTASVNSVRTRNSSIDKESFSLNDAEGKSVQELQRMLRQERLVRNMQRRLQAERQLKKQKTTDS